jgi:DNA excision repair protein ERCC-5
VVNRHVLFRPAQVVPDPDLREYQAHMALSAIGNRSQSQIQSSTKRFQKTKSIPLFDFDEDEDEFPTSGNMLQYSSEDDEELAYAVQDSFDQKQSTKAFDNFDVDGSHSRSKTSSSFSTDVHGSQSKANLLPSKRLSQEENLFASPTRLETALSIAGAGPSRTHPLLSAFGRPVLLSPPLRPPSTALLHTMQDSAVDSSNPPAPKIPSGSKLVSDVDTMSDSNKDLEESIHFPAISPSSVVRVADARIISDSDEDTDMEEIIPEPDVNITNEARKILSSTNRSPLSVPTTFNTSLSHALELRSFDEGEQDEQPGSPSLFEQLSHTDSSERAPSPVHDSWDAAQEMDPHAEEGEFARFISQVKGKDIDDVRREIDDEIKSLNQQKKADMRDSEDITQQMVSQIMVSWNASFTSIPLSIQCTDYATSFWHSIHHSTDGGGSTMRRTGFPWTCGWRNHR